MPLWDRTFFCQQIWVWVFFAKVWPIFRWCCLWILPWWADRCCVRLLGLVRRDPWRLEARRPSVRCRRNCLERGSFGQNYFLGFLDFLWTWRGPGLLSLCAWLGLLRLGLSRTCRYLGWFLPGSSWCRSELILTLLNFWRILKNWDFTKI